MNTSSITTTLLLAGFVLAGCTQSTSPATSETADETVTEVPAAMKVAPEVDDTFSETGDQTYLEPITLAEYTTKVMHIGDVSKGHFNLYIEGGEPAAVRAWIGDEAATNAVITRAEFEADHHCAHLEVAQPLPEDAKFWLEIETTDGQKLKGNSPLK